MFQVPLGDTGFQVSDLVLGTYKMGARDWGAVNDLDSLATLKYCIDQGVNLIDTATGYGMGRAERLIRYALDDEGALRRGRALVLTKIYLWEDADGEAIRSVSPQMQAKFLKGCRRRLRMEQLDLVLLHRDDQFTPIERAVEALAGFQAQGQVRWIGVSNYSLAQLERAQKTAPLQNFQPHFSLLDTRFRDDGRLDFCRQNRISVGVYGVLERGLLAPRFKEPQEYPEWDTRSRRGREKGFAEARRIHARLGQVAQRFDRSVSQLAIAWVLSHPGVTFAILGASTPQQAAHALEVSGWRLSAEVLGECEAIVREEQAKGP